ncbi:MAG: GTP-binding protein, partial [Lysinibacillus sp.]
GQMACAQKFEQIQSSEKEMLKHIHAIQNHLMGLAKTRLHQIENKVNELNNQRVREQRQLKSYAAKLNEFTCLIEAQGFLRDAIEPFLMDEKTPLTERERQMVKETITAICAVDLSYNGLLTRSKATNRADDTIIEFDFEQKYPLHALKLTEADVKSKDIPEVPIKLEIIYNES